MSDNKECDYNAELDKYIENLKKCEYIQDDRAVKTLCEKAIELLTREENIIYLNAPITVRKKYNMNYNKYIFIFIFIDLRRYTWPIL